MQNRKSHPWGLTLFCLPILLLAGTAGAATVVDTLYPDDDGYYTAWETKTFMADEHEEIDDPELTCGSESEDTYLHVNGLGAVSSWRITNPADTMGKDIQSVKVEWEMAYQTDGSTTGDAKVAIGWAFNDVPWQVCDGGEPGYDTVEITDECVVYGVTWTEQPCPGGTVDWQWIYLGFFDEDYYQPFIWSISVRNGCGALFCQNRCFNVRIIVTSETEEASQIFLIGARDEENYRNPRRGIPPAAWE